MCKAKLSERTWNFLYGVISKFTRHCKIVKGKWRWMTIVLSDWSHDVQGTFKWVELLQFSITYLLLHIYHYTYIITHFFYTFIITYLLLHIYYYTFITTHYYYTCIGTYSLLHIYYYTFIYVKIETCTEEPTSLLNIILNELSSNLAYFNAENRQNRSSYRDITSMHRICFFLFLD